MPVTDKESGPYAPSSQLLEVIQRYRDGTVITPITYDVLARIGFKDTPQKRVLASLKVLDLVDDDGKPTPEFDKIKHAPSGEYQAVLAGHLKEAYAEVFTLVDPAKAKYEEIFDAFRTYKPASVRNRMVTLFLALCHEAGLVAEIPTPDRSQSSESRTRSPRSSTNGTRAGTGNADAAKEEMRTTPTDPPQREQPTPPPEIKGLHPALAGLLNDLPEHGSAWTEESRGAFLNAFNALLDLYYPAKPPKRQSASQGTIFNPETSEDSA